MPKTREKSPEEYLRGKLRELEKENKALRRRIKQLQKQEHFYEGQDDKEVTSGSEDTMPKTVARIHCMDCGKGTLKVFELIGRVFQECDTCGSRKKISG